MLYELDNVNRVIIARPENEGEGEGYLKSIARILGICCVDDADVKIENGVLRAHLASDRTPLDALQFMDLERLSHVPCEVTTNVPAMAAAAGA